MRSLLLSITFVALAFSDLQADEPIEWSQLNLPFSTADRFDCSAIPQSVHELLGKTVAIEGAIAGGSIFKAKGNRQFILLDKRGYNTGIRSAPLDRRIWVRLVNDDTIDYTPDRIRVTGRLVVDEFTGEGSGAWIVYFLIDASTSRK